jgi:hypothetical protein
MHWMLFVWACIERPPKIDEVNVPILEVKKFQYGDLEGMLIDDMSSKSNRAIVYVGLWKSSDINCFKQDRSDYRRILIIASQEQQKGGVSYLQKQGYAHVSTGEYPCR